MHNIACQKWYGRHATTGAGLPRIATEAHIKQPEEKTTAIAVETMQLFTKL